MCAIRLWGWSILVALAFALPSWGGEPRSTKVRVDLYGDPLPDGASVRLGSIRFRHPGPVRDIAFSPDGKLIAASSAGLNMVILWERATGRKVREISLGTKPGQSVDHLRFSDNGKRLYASCWSRGMNLFAWDVATGADSKDIPHLPMRARTIGYSPDGREMILVQNEAAVVLWDIDTGKELGRYRKPGTKYLNMAARAGERVLVPYFDGEAVGMWDVTQNKQLWSMKTTRDKFSPDLPMAFSADGKLFAVEAPPKEISVYESVTGKVVHRLKGDAGEFYFSLCISPDAQLVVGHNADGGFHIWDLDSGRIRCKTPAPPFGMAVILFAPDSKVFAVAGGNFAHAVLLWDAASGKPIDPFPGHVTPVSWVSFSPDGRTAATSSWIRGDSVVRLWDTRTGRQLRSFDPLNSGGVTAVAFSPDGETLAASHWKHWKDETKVRLWNVHTGRELHALTGHARNHDCICVAYSPDGKRLASGDDFYDNKGEYSGRLCIWDAKAGKLIREVRGTRGAIQQLLFSPDGRYVLAAANGVHVYDAESGRLIGQPFQTKTRVWRLALSADGRLLATADGQGGPVRLWELATRREIPLALPNTKGYGVALTSDGRTLAAIAPHSNVALFHWPSGEKVGKLSSADGVGNQVFFSPDGRRLATADNYESTVLIWDVANLVNRPLPAVAKPSEAELRLWWAALCDDDPAEAYKAVWRFVAVPEQALPFLAASVSPIKHADPAVVARLIDDLDSGQFEVRERASRELIRLGEAVAGALRKARSSGPSLEQRLRIERLLDKLDGLSFEPEQLRTTRALAVLEQIGGPQARKVLAGLAAGAVGARLTLEAESGLERLKRGER